MEIYNWMRQAHGAYRRRKIWQRIVMTMAVIVVFCTTYALILPAITLESPAVCGLTEHSHTDGCYEQTETVSGTLVQTQSHVHTDSCLQESRLLTCTLDETAAHAHDETCRERLLSCGLEEKPAHTHEPACYSTEQTLPCGLEESETHSHTDDCAAQPGTLLCTLEETQGHAHAESCFRLTDTLVCGQEEAVGHSHGDACYTVTQQLCCGLEEIPEKTEPEKHLICGLTEHTHTQTCYPVPETQTTTEAALPEGDPTADLETRENWEASLAAAELTCELRQDCIRIARTQLGYEESRSNFIYDENTRVRSYSRYGQWIGEPYGDWNGAFVSFCLHYAGAVPYEPTAEGQQLLDQMLAEQCYAPAGAHAPIPGDLIFLDRDGDGRCDFVAIVEELLSEGSACRVQDVIPMAGTEQSSEEIPVRYTGEDGIAQVIAGGVKGRVDRVTLCVSDPAVMGFGILQEEQETAPAAAHIHEGESGSVTQVLFAGETAVPQDAELTVAELPCEAETSLPMIRQIEELLDAQPLKISLLDISFYDAEGSYLPVADTAQVIMDLDIADAAPENIRVFHFVDGAPVELERVSVTQNAVAVMALAEETGEVPQLHTQLMFETDGFSVFAVVVVGQTEQVENRINLTDPASLANNTYYFVSNNENYVMADVLGDYKMGLGNDTYGGPDSLNGKTTWTFLPTEGDRYYIRSSGGHYLWMQDTTNEAAWVDLKDSAEEATAFTVRAINGQAEIGYDGPDGIAHYLNVYRGNEDFCGWKDSGYNDSGSKVYLHTAAVSDQPDLVGGLGGKSFALISNAEKKAVGTETAAVNNVPGLQSVAVSTVQTNGVLYYTGDAPVWSFAATETEGVYHISTQTDAGTQYLRLLDTYYEGNSAVSKGSLSLSDTAQEICVTANGDGTVCLAVHDGENTGYINLDQSGSGSFWVYNDMADSNKLLLAQKATGISLIYHLNAPASSNWINEPGLEDYVQEVTEEGVRLHSVSGANEAGSFVYNDLQHAVRSSVRAYYNAYNESLGDSLTPENYRAPGAEHRFVGWRATVNGESFLFPENAEAVRHSDGIHITDTEGVERVLPADTSLQGQWEKVSDVVMFFVNFGATMLDTQDNKVIEDYGSNFYTGVAAIGHIYHETTINPDKNSAGRDVISRYKDAIIQGEIVPAYDADDPATQIVIDAVARINAAGDGFEFKHVSNYNQSQLENAVGLYLQNDPNTATQVRIDNAFVDKREISAENYKLYWYLQKPVDSDGWHIDGVLVAKTHPIELLKTFSGLTETEAEEAIGRMRFPLGLIGTDGTRQDYTTLAANTSQEGVYANHGRQSAGNIYRWTLRSILGQRYAFAEESYQVPEHDWSGLVSVHYTDGTVSYRYNTDSTYTDRDLYDGSLVGGTVESVIFANFYTKTGTGAFSISKVVDEAGRIRLQGAEFTLTGETDPDFLVTAVTNENGAVHFADLEPGRYTLRETKAPEGYQSAEDVWPVAVTGTDSGSVTVTLQKQGSSQGPVTLYDSADGGLKEVYLIRNLPEDTTVTVNKYFQNISQKEVQELEDYRIEVCDGSGAVMRTLTLADAVPITGSAGAYSWTLNLECDSTYTFVEKNFLHENYLDTVVSAAVNGTAREPERRDTDGDGTPDTASLTLRKGDAADTVTITNAYTNTFELKIRKVDATGDYAPMQGVEFNIYGSFSEATGSESLEYVDDNGIRHTAYLIGKTAPTDEQGITWYDNMKLSAGTRSFIYVVDEVATPAGYVELDEPIVRMVAVDGENYANGVYTLTVENFKRDLADVTVTATKQWDIPEDMEPTPVTLTLYRKASDGTVTRLQDVTLDGTDKSLAESGMTATVTGWKVVWEGLTYAADTTRYEYYVSEEPQGGFHVTYSTAITALQVGDSEIPAAIAEGTNLKRSVTVINSVGYALPETGGSGTGSLRLSGLALLAAAAFLYGQDRRKRRMSSVKSGGPDSRT